MSKHDWDEIEHYRVHHGSDFSLADVDPDDRRCFPDGDKDAGRKQLTKDAEEQEARQRLLWADGRHGVLLVLQGMDTAGKDGTIRHVAGPLNPQGVAVANFKRPTPEEASHDYLWRVHAHVPARGMIGIFNRSHYEDLVVPRVLAHLSDDAFTERCDHVTAFERYLTSNGIAIVKVFLHISKDEQKDRLQSRLDNPEKNWKFEPGDLDTRKLWDDYQRVYSEVIARTSHAWAPWYVVPANHKWYRDLVVGQLLHRTLGGLDLAYPPPHPDLESFVIED